MNLPLRVRVTAEHGRVTGTITHDPDQDRWIAYLDRTDEVAIFATPEAAYGYIHAAIATEYAAPKPKPTVIR